MPDDDYERFAREYRENPERYAAAPRNRIFGRRELPVLGLHEADFETAEALREIHPHWCEAFLCVQQAKERFLADPHDETVLENHHRAWSLLRRIESRTARLALLSASVILPGEPLPRTLAAPARVDIGGRWSVLVSPPVHAGGRLRVHFFYGLK